MEHPLLDALPNPAAPVRSEPLVPEQRENPYVVAIASAQVLDVGAVEEVAAAAESTGEVDGAVIERLGMVVARANNDYFRFVLDSPLRMEVVGVARVRGADLLPGIEPDRSTRKLTVALLLRIGTEDGRSRAVTAVPPKEAEVSVGTAVVFPSFAPVMFRLAPDEPVDALVAFVHGPPIR